MIAPTAPGGKKANFQIAFGKWTKAVNDRLAELGLPPLTEEEKQAFAKKAPVFRPFSSVFRLVHR